MSVYVGFKIGKAIERKAYISEYYCGACGFPVSDHDSYCPECGGAFRKEDATERTCKVVGTISMDWSDGSTVYEHELSCGHTCHTDWTEPPAFCGECGARVVDE